MNERVNEFKAKNAQSHPCGEKSFWDNFKKKTYIKDLDGKILYEGRGPFQRVLENAVRKGIELPRADLRNQTFEGLQIPNAKLRGASFENSTLAPKEYKKKGNQEVDISNSDLREVSFKNTHIKYINTFYRYIDLADSDVEKADFDGKAFKDITVGFARMFNFDKARNILRGDLESWQHSQSWVKDDRDEEKARKEKERKSREVINPDKDPLDQVIKTKCDEIKKTVEAMKQKSR